MKDRPRRSPFIGADPHEGRLDMDYFVWAAIPPTGPAVEGIAVRLDAAPALVSSVQGLSGFIPLLPSRTLHEPGNRQVSGLRVLEPGSAGGAQFSGGEPRTLRLKTL
jgi:hypothetical protein